MCNMCNVRCSVASRTLSRVCERSVAAVQWESAGRREPPACLRATAARAAARPARATRAPRTACTGTRRPHRAASLPHYLPVRAAAGSRTTRLSMCSVRCVARSRRQARGGGRRRGAARTAGGRSCALRHASVSTLSCVLPQPAICRDVRAGSGSEGTPPSHCDGVNALRVTLRITSEKLERAQLLHICRSQTYYFYL